jgi:hypothetical protein
MFRIDYKFDAKVLERAVLKAAADEITKRVRNVRCGEHGTYAQIVARGSTVKNLSLDVWGCCPQLIADVRSKLK